MTAIKLHKLLGQLIEAGHGRKNIMVDKSSFQHPCEEDGVVILDIHKVMVRSYPIYDDDGDSKFRKDGTECYHNNIVITGGSEHI
ncbi:conserved hypothetical protein [Gammaproteobacteria bacterium]